MREAQTLQTHFLISLLAHVAYATLLVLTLGAGKPAGARGAEVEVAKTPQGGIQPQAVVDTAGRVHLLFFKGEPGKGDLFYAVWEPKAAGFSTPVQVNSQPGSAIATGTIRGGQLVLGKEGRVHVAWNGSMEAKPKNPIMGTPMLYSRSSLDRTAFEPQRNLMQRTFGLDGGGTVAADEQGNVFVLWHGKAVGAPDGEIGRRVWMARSSDQGATFAPEEPAGDDPTGACACCGTRALADRSGTLYMLYRAATAGVERDMTLLWSRDSGRTFQRAVLDPWKINACPMSSETMITGARGVIAAWETQGQVRLARLDPATGAASKPTSPPGAPGNRKHPALATNSRGETLLAWTEGTGWQRGGTLVWQLFDPSGQPQGAQGRLEAGVPTWGLPTALARPDGSFLIIH
jgi:hypothetical protein